MNATDDDDSPYDGPSKSQRKRESLALQDLGEALVALPADRLARIEMPESLRTAVLEARRIRAFGALKRQRQFIGKLMRTVDAAPIRAQMEAFEGNSRAEAAWLHRLERWRDRLIAEDTALAELLAQHPDADAQHLRTLVRNARREASESKPPRAFREIFRTLRELIPQPAPTVAPASPTDTETDPEDDDTA